MFAPVLLICTVVKMQCILGAAVGREATVAGATTDVNPEEPPTVTQGENLRNSDLPLLLHLVSLQLQGARSQLPPETQAGLSSLLTSLNTLATSISGPLLSFPGTELGRCMLGQLLGGIMG